MRKIVWAGPLLHVPCARRALDSPLAWMLYGGSSEQSRGVEHAIGVFMQNPLANLHLWASPCFCSTASVDPFASPCLGSSRSWARYTPPSRSLPLKDLAAAWNISLPAGVIAAPRSNKGVKS